MRFLGILLIIAGTSYAAESVILLNGARIHAERHELDGAKIRIYDGPGYIEMDLSKVQGFEAEEPAAPPVAAAALQAPTTPLPAAQMPAATPLSLSPQELADQAADKYDLPRRLVRSVMAAESGNQTRAVSPKGAIGLMQLMPGTAAALGADPNDPVQNVDAGARYLRDLLVKYDGYLWHALAAYNAGPAAVDRYKGVPPYRETINYVRRIDSAFKKDQ